MSTDDSFKEVKEAISSTLIDTTRTAGQIAGEDLTFYRSTNPEITPLLEKQNTRLLQLAQNLVRVAATGTEVSAPRLSDADSVEDNWRGIVDVIDNLLEKADACLDEYTGVIKRLSPSQDPQPSKSNTPARKPLPLKNYRNQNIPKPQRLFAKVPCNDETTPFKPLLRSKPHAVVPLENSIALTSSSLKGPPQYEHPYATEIQQSKYPASTYVKSDPIPYLPFETTKATLVDTPEAVAAMLEELRSAKEIAVDLEHHDTHTYVGLVSLMQISTRDKDWIVDTLKPWREELQVLNEVFADPNIVKVFHGSNSDIIWLQRDLGLYVVGLFDTYHASRVLGYAKHSLASLLSRFVNFDADKQYQMADWRIRPLPEQMFDYARSDTHFLLYIYDNMRNQLIEKSDFSQLHGNLVDEVLNRSKEEALQRYEHQFYDVQDGTGLGGWAAMLSRTPASFNEEQLAVFKAVHQWRDTIARQEDESVHHILPKHALFSIAREMPLDKPALLRCSHPISSVFRARAGELLTIIYRAKVAGVSDPVLKETMQAQGSTPAEIQAQVIPVDSADSATDPAAAQVIKPPQIPISKLPVRIKRSQFWGPTLDCTTWHGSWSGAQTQQDGPRLALALPQLTAQIFDDKNSLAPGSSEGELRVRAEHQFVRDREAKKDDVFIVKQLGGSRKRKASDLQDTSEAITTGVNSPAGNGTGYSPDNNVEKSLNDVNVDQHSLEKADRKAQRKAQKKLDKKQRKREERGLVSGAGDGEGREETEAFDYANAPSVLHARRDNNGRSGPKKSFDPYTKSMDAPTGMRKSKKEIAGKSFTFKQ